jgi:hypothetical protein
MSNRQREKDVMPNTSMRREESKNSNLQHKILPGYVRAERVKCGKSNCKCARGELHGLYYYHYTWADNKRMKTYVKPEDVEATKAACENYRNLQVELRIGRIGYKALMARVRELLG